MMLKLILILINQFEHPQIIQNNLNYNFESNNNKEKNIIKFNVKFIHQYGNETVLICNANDIISEVIGRYREKSKDYNENLFSFKGKKSDEHSSSTLQEKGIRNWSAIIVQAIGSLKGGNFII